MARMVFIVMNNYRMPFFQYGEIDSVGETESETPGCGVEGASGGKVR